MDKMPTCETCRFFQRKKVSREGEWLESASGYCRRYAPRPHNFLKYYELELFRAIGLAVHQMAYGSTPSEVDDLHEVATQAMVDASWPEVEDQDWCGEWMKLLVTDR